jgi:hypothetical protein
MRNRKLSQPRRQKSFQTKLKLWVSLIKNCNIIYFRTLNEHKNCWFVFTSVPTAAFRRSVCPLLRTHGSIQTVCVSFAPYPRQHSDGLCVLCSAPTAAFRRSVCPFLRRGNSVNIFYQMPPRNKLMGFWSGNCGSQWIGHLRPIHQPWRFQSIKLITLCPYCGSAPLCWYSATCALLYPRSVLHNSDSDSSIKA